MVSAEGAGSAGWMLRQAKLLLLLRVNPARSAGTEGWECSGCQACGGFRPREQEGQDGVKAEDQHLINCFLLFHRYQARDGIVSYFDCVV